MQFRFGSSLLMVFCLIVMFPLSAFAGSDDRAFKIFDSTDVDYQPSIIRVEPSGDLMMVFERLDPSSFRGDMYVTKSTDNGLTWAQPWLAVGTSMDERHPSLIQDSQNQFVLFYLAFNTNDYQIHRATSPDGITWTTHGQIDLGWTTKGPGNPCAIAEDDGSITMAYQRIGSRCYIARSLDNGVTWDHLKTQLTSGTAALPRIAKRETDGRYMLTYQTGSTCKMWSKTTFDPYTWPTTATAFDTNTNAHDSQPMVLEGGMFVVTYAQATTQYFDVCYRTSFDGERWSDCIKVTTDPSHYDTQPHPIRTGTAGEILIAWSKQQGGSPYVDHDIYVEPALMITMPLQPDKEILSAAAGEIIDFDLDAGAAKANRKYLLLAGASGTDPGTALPGGTTTLPLNWDIMTDFCFSMVNTAVFNNFLSTLDASGQSTAQLNTFGPLPSTMIGTILSFAYCLNYPWEYASNPVLVEVQP